MPNDPLPQGPAPALNRAWSRRGWAAAPHFGQSVQGIVAETTITITRSARVPNDIAGFGAIDPVTIFTGAAHVERIEETRERLAGPVEGVMGSALFHHWEIYLPVPAAAYADPTQLPRKGDRVQFSDGFQQRDLPIMYVARSAGLNDHLELSTDEFQA